MRTTLNRPLPTWKQSIIGASLAACFVLMSPTLALAEQADFTATAEIVRSIYLRAGAGKNTRAMAVLPKGERVTILQQTPDWTEIRRTGSHPNAQEGWVNTALLQISKTPAQANATPVKASKHLRPVSQTQETPQPAAPQSPATAQDKENITLNFVNADIQSVVKTVGMITGKNFILDPRITGNFNIVSVNPISRDLVYPILLSALRLHGYAAVEEKGFVKIVPEADAKLNFSKTDRKSVV